MPVTLTPNPVADNLASVDRATENPLLSALNTSSPSYLAALLATASDSIRRLCHRDFNLAAYSEYYSGGDYQRAPLRLREFPVVSVSRVATNPAPALLVANGGASCQRATVATSATGLVLASVSSGVAATTTLAYSAYVTVQSLAAAVNALGSGWSASVQSGRRGSFALWASSDLRPLQGAMTALGGGAWLEAYEEELNACPGPGCGGFGDDEGWGGSWGWRLDGETGELHGRFPRGRLNIRVDYVAGFSPVPAAIQEACVQHVQDMYQMAQVNSNVSKATLGQYSYALKSVSETSTVSGKVKALIAPYIAYDKTISRS